MSTDFDTLTLLVYLSRNQVFCSTLSNLLLTSSEHRGIAQHLVTFC